MAWLLSLGASVSCLYCRGTPVWVDHCLFSHWERRRVGCLLLEIVDVAIIDFHLQALCEHRLEFLSCVPVKIKITLILFYLSLIYEICELLLA